MIKVTSTAIKGISFRASDNTLFVQFISGGTWAYKNVSKRQYRNVRDGRNYGGSVGKAFHGYIRGRYTSERVD